MASCVSGCLKETVGKPAELVAGASSPWLLVMLLVMFHADFRFGGLITMLRVLFSRWVVGLSGFLGAFLYVVIPRSLGASVNPCAP